MEILVNGDFVGSLTPWTQEALGGNAWTWASDRAEVTPYPSGADILKQSFSINLEGDYIFSANCMATLFEFGGPGTGNYDVISLVIELYLDGIFSESFGLGPFQSNAVDTAFSQTYTVTYPFDEVKIYESFIFGMPGGTYVTILYDISISSIPVAVITPSKNSPVWTYQLNDQLYYNNNKNYFDRGAYARPWPAGQLLTGYVKIDVGTSVESQPIKCGTGTVLGFTQGYKDIGSGVFKWWVLLPPNNIDGFYIEIFAKTGSTYHTHSIYSNFKTLTGVTAISTEKGFSFRIKEIALIVSATLQLNIAVATTLPIITKIYRADPHKLDKLTLLATVNNSTMTGLTGDQTITLNIESRGWNIGDIAVVTLQSQDGSVRLKYRDIPGEIDPNGFYYDIVNGPSYQTQVVGVKVLAYTAAETEMLVQTHDPLIMVSYRNNNTYDFVPANIQEQTWIRGNFWQPAYPAEFEDIEILPGEFTRLRNEWNRTRQFETDYMPGYLHELFSHILGSDSVNIQGTEVIQRDAYVMDFPNRQYGLVKGKVLLTEKTSIQRNVI